MDHLVMAVIGAQYPPSTPSDELGISTITNFITAVPPPTHPSFYELASVIDKCGASNKAVFAYWSSAELYKHWESSSGFSAWWKSSDRESDGHGWFLEVLNPTLDRFETIFSNNAHPEGAANMQESISGEVKEHGYWGSCRDRLPAAQDDKLAGDKERAEHWSGNSNTSTRIRVPGKSNLCIIRSGQDWSGTLPAERKLYLETMHPVLIGGMDFLRDKGQDIGCYAMNLWDVVDEKCEANQERTFGLGYFDDLAALEKWSKSHQTHVNIFGGFLVYAKKLKNLISLRLYHEIYVLEGEQQFFEYVGCHGETGMMCAVGNGGRSEVSTP
jgi:hypothetical protein